MFTLVESAPFTAIESNKSLETIQNQWYNTLVASLGLDASSFQLIQSSSPLPTLSRDLWAIVDAVPPKSLTNSFVAAQFNSFFDNYRAVILTLLNPQGNEFQVVMGDLFPKWTNYLANYSGDIPSGGLPELFKSWATLNIPDPSTASQAYSALISAQNSPITLAKEQVIAADLDSGVAKYNRTISDLRAAIPHGQSRTVIMDSKTASSNVQHTWAKAQASGLYRFFSAGASGSFDELSTRAEKSQVSISATYSNVISFPLSPGQWYSSSALNTAYHTQDNTIWPAGGQPTWKSTFSQTGNLQRAAVNLIVVDGIEATITSSASYSSSEQEALKGSANLSIFPFFGASGSGGSSKNISFDNTGKMTIKISSPKGNPTILGVNVLSVNQFLGGNQEALTSLSALRFVNTVDIPAKTHRSFPAPTKDLRVRIKRSAPFGGAQYIVYNTQNPDEVLGGGNPPALSAKPPYCELIIRRNTPFTIQSVGETGIQVEVL